MRSGYIQEKQALGRRDCTVLKSELHWRHGRLTHGIMGDREYAPLDLIHMTNVQWWPDATDGMFQ